MRVTYTSTLLGQTREHEIDYSGTGFGADLSTMASSGLRACAFSTTTMATRWIVRAPCSIPAIPARFPAGCSSLFGSMATQAAGAPDREASAVLGWQFTHWSLTADVQWQRDALTADKTKGAGPHAGADTGQTLRHQYWCWRQRGGDAGTVPWVSLALTLHSAK